MQTKNSVNEIAEKLEAAGCEVKVWNDSRAYINKTPNGSKGQYGYCVDGDDGSTGTCENVTKRRGEICAILRS